MTARLSRNASLGVSQHTVDRLMRDEGMNGLVRGRKIRTTIPAKDDKRAGHLLNRDFTTPFPNHSWVTDFTYVATWAGFVIAVCRLLCNPQSINLIEHRGAEGLPTENAIHGPTRHVPLDVFRALARLEAGTTSIGLCAIVLLEVRSPLVKMTGKRQIKRRKACRVAGLNRVAQAGVLSTSSTVSGMGCLTVSRTNRAIKESTSVIVMSAASRGRTNKIAAADTAAMAKRMGIRIESICRPNCPKSSPLRSAWPRTARAPVWNHWRSWVGTVAGPANQAVRPTRIAMVESTRAVCRLYSVICSNTR